MHGDEVRLGEQVVQRDRVDLHRLGPAGGQIGVVGKDSHPKSLRPFGDLAPDAAEAHDAEHLAEEFQAREALPIPLAGPHRSGRLGHRPGAAKNMGKGQFSRGDRVARRGVHDDDPAFGGGVDIHVVHPHPRPAHHLEVGRGGEDLGGDLGLRAHRDGLDVLHQFEQLRRRRAIGLDHGEFGLLAEPGDPLGRDLVGDQDFHGEEMSIYQRKVAGRGKQGIIDPGKDLRAKGTFLGRIARLPA